MKSRTIGEAIAATAAALVLAGCSGTPGGSGPQQGMGAAPAGDAAGKIEAKLKADPALAGASIKAAATNGTIVLTGTVKTMAQKDHAEDVTYGVETEMKLQPGVMDQLEIAEGAGAKDAGAAAH